jgi:predicted naringenin-chalcone synthase
MYPTIASIGTSVPPCSITQEKADELFSLYYKEELRPRSLDVLHQIVKHPSIKKRHIAVGFPEDLPQLKNEDPDVRIERFTRWAKLLSTEAIRTALNKRNLSVKDVDALFVNTCTGYICPGLSTYLIEDLGFSKNIQAFDLVGSGCGGALPNLQLSSQYCISNRGKIALSVSVEICSATYQMSNDMSLIVSNAIFADGAAAAVVWDKPRGMRLLASDQCFLPEYRDDIRYKYKGGQLHNSLSQRLPAIVGQNVKTFVKSFLDKNDLNIEDISYYVIHSGGDKVLNACAESLGLSDDKMEFARNILQEYGNMSSPTVLFELEQVESKIKKDETCLMLGFGAGLSVYGWLLRGQ